MIGTPPVSDAFWEKTAASVSPALILDYDGTLAPFRRDPSRAVPYPGVRDLLVAIVGGRTRVFVVSGRSGADVLRLLAVPGVEIWGEHGGERLEPNGADVLFSLGERHEAFLEEAERNGRKSGGKLRFERKRLSLAVHARGMPDGSRFLESVARSWRSLIETGDSEFVLRQFDGGLELRLGSVTKALAVTDIMRRTDDSDAIAYLGDDLTDEDAFHALGCRGLSVLVRKTFRPSSARCLIIPPGELIAFLRKWEASVKGEKP